jgi:8-oxo-dGTP pyrophosphatase MutT (NUDIX family)
MSITLDLISGAIAGLGAPTQARNWDLVSASTRNAAVVVGIRLSPEPTVLAVLRSPKLKEHGGEVGFPGGKQEPADADLRSTALRELEEEVGVGAAQVEVLGQLTPVPVITGRYLIHPFVAHVREGASPSVCSEEIERILEIPLWPWLTAEMRICGVEGTWRGRASTAPYFELSGCVLYGASAFIFFELLANVAAKLGRELPPMVMRRGFPWGDRY